MDRADVTFTVGLNTSPAEQQLHNLGEKMKSTAHIYSDVFKDVGQGFKTVGSPYQNSNNYGVPSTQVLERSIAMIENSMEKFARVVESMSMRMVNFSTVGNPYTPNQRVIYSQPTNIAGYLPSSTVGNIRPWAPTEHYTHPQVDAINNPSKVFDYLINKRMAEQSADNPYIGVYDTFSRINSPMGAMGMYAMWSKLFGGKAPLRIEGTVGNPSGADGNDTIAEQANDVVEGDKKDNEELKEKLLLWGKIMATIYAIRKVITGLAKLWKFGAETATGVNRNINEDHGFFTIDPEGAFRANSDKTRAVLYAGIRNMGENAPVSKEGLDYASSKMTEMWTAAMSGRNVDARTTIDVQRLKDFFGIDLSVAGLLTGEREGKTATDIQLDMMEKVETQLSKLAEADEITKGQVIDSLKNILGDELVNAIVANANKNLKIDATDLKLTLAERIMQSGGSAIPSGNLTEATTKAVTSISNLNNAVQSLKNTLVQELSPAFSKFTDALARIVNWINKKLNKVDGTRDANGEIMFKTSVAALTQGRNAYGVYSQNKSKDQKDKFENKTQRILNDMKSKNVYDIFEAMYLSQIEADNASDIENMGIKAVQDSVGKSMIKGGFNKNSKNPIERALANYKWTDAKGKEHEGWEAFKLQGANEENLGWWNADVNNLFYHPESMDEAQKIKAYQYFLEHNRTAKDAFTNAFTEGGELDYNTGMNIFRYFMNPAFYNSPEEFLNFMNEMRRQAPQVGDNTFDIEPSWNDRDRNGRIDAGEVEVKLRVKDISDNVLGTYSLVWDMQ